MNEDMSKLLAFQKADLEYRNLVRDIAGNEHNKKMRVAKKTFDAAKQKIGESEQAAAGAMSVHAAVSDGLGGWVARAEQLCAAIAADNLGEDEESALLGELETLRASIGEWEKKLSQAKANADRAIADYRAAQESGKNAKAEYADAKVKFEKVRGELEKNLGTLKEKRDSLAAAVDKRLMDMYATLAAENKLPAFVAAMGDEKNPVCGACGMSLAETAKNELKSGGLCRCETCGHMIYKN